MNATIRNPGSMAGMQWLSQTRELSAFRVANQELGRLQAQRLVEAGCRLEPSPEPASRDLVQMGNAWLSLSSLQLLRQLGGPARIVAVTGAALAWTGSQKPTGDAESIQAKGEDSLLLYPWDLLRLNEILMGRLEPGEVQGEISPAAHVEGRVRVGKGTRVLPGVFIEGNVIIGEHCRIGPNCYLRGFTAIGDHCRIGNAVEIKNTMIGNRTSVGHLSYCGDSIIGEDVNLGAGTITANLRHDGANHRSMIEGVLVDTGRRKFGTVIGDGVHTGIHTSIYPGRKLWPGTSTRPGEVVQRDILLPD
jgi:UDP-N-acetylglucosamine diphosphorylase / glucose-1-phosphate thymidylyltransferase / UDP-N-acetylgalactosamine diphosphorylase / glucosamine-1-phosphate N-acetyltransferase / galactosamine-1-phosphate N-acetyltransferase